MLVARWIATGLEVEWKFRHVKDYRELAELAKPVKKLNPQLLSQGQVA